MAYTQATPIHSTGLLVLPPPASVEGEDGIVGLVRVGRTVAVMHRDFFARIRQEASAVGLEEVRRLAVTRYRAIVTVVHPMFFSHGCTFLWLPEDDDMSP